MVDRHLVRRELLDGIAVLARIQRRHVRAATRDIHLRANCARVCLLPRAELLVRQRVAGNLHRLAGTKPVLALRLVCTGAGDADGEHEDGGVHDVPAVAAAILTDQAEERACRAGAAYKLEHDRARDERGERVRQETRGRGVEAEADQYAARDDRDRERNEEGLPERAQRCPAPGDERADPHQQEKRQPEAVQEEVVVRLRDRTRLAAHRLRKQRIHHAPQDRQAEGDE